MKKIILTYIMATYATFAFSQVGLYPFNEEGMFGYLKSTLENGIDPQYTYASDFSDGVALVAKEGSYMNSKKGYINDKGVWIIEPKYIIAGDFSEGLARVSIEYKWGYINLKDEVVIKPQFQLAYEFENGYAQAQKGGKWGIIDKTGEFVVTPAYYNVTNYSGKVFGCQETMYKQWVLKDLNGKTISKDSLSRIGSFDNGLAPARNIENLYGYINEEGKWIIEPKFTNAHIFKGGLAAVEVDSKSWGFINTEGELVIPASYDRHAVFKGDWARVEKGDRIIYINKNGEEVYYYDK